MDNYIDRNPEQMIRYGKDATRVLDEMTVLLRKLESVLDVYKNDLDTPSQEQITELHSCCETFYSEMEAYRRVAQTVEEKGKRLARVRNGG